MITQNYAFDSRQTAYYIDAGVYLGLIKKPLTRKSLTCKLTDKGTALFQLKYKQRQLEYCKCILSHKAFYNAAKVYFQRGQMPEKGEIVEIMKSSKLYNVKAEATFERRASTVRAWVEWIARLI